MTDLFDRAQKLEQRQRQAEIDAHLNRASETPDIDEDGNRWCLNCGEQIPAARIQALPNVVRCVHCQSRKEEVR